MNERIRRSFPQFAAAVDRGLGDLEQILEPASADDIAKLELDLDIPLPASYKEFLKCSRGFWAMGGSVQLASHHPFFHEFPPLEELSEAQKNVVKQRGGQWPPPSQGMLCFAEFFMEADGDQLLFDVSHGLVDDEYPVYYYAHEDSPASVRKLEDSFGDWLSKFLEYEAFQDHDDFVQSFATDELRPSRKKREFGFRGESLVLDAEARSAAPGEFVELPDGVTHYELVGPDDGQTIVLVHGFSTPSFIWDPTFNPLAEAGFRVLRYDLFGRGYSDRPNTVYGLDLFNRQLLDLLSALNIPSPVDLVGLSMGGAISVGFTDRQPAMVRKLGLVDPGGFPLKVPFAARFLFVSGLGEWIMSLFGSKILLAGMQADVYQTEVPPEWMEQYRKQMQYKGFKHAILSTLRHGPMINMADAYARVGKQEREVLLIWGCQDQTVPFEINEKVRQAIPHAEFHAIDEAGHLPHLEHPNAVNSLLIEFLKK